MANLVWDGEAWVSEDTGFEYSHAQVLEAKKTGKKLTQIAEEQGEPRRAPIPYSPEPWHSMPQDSRLFEAIRPSLGVLGQMARPELGENYATAPARAITQGSMQALQSLGGIAEFGKDFTSPAGWLEWALGQDDQKTAKARQGVNIITDITQTLANEPSLRTRPEGLVEEFGVAVGNAIPFFAAQTVAAMATGGGSIPGAMGGLAMGGDQYTKARRRGASKNWAAVEAGIVGGVGSLLERGGFDIKPAQVKKLSDLIVKAIPRQAAKSLAEGGTEIAQEILTRAVDSVIGQDPEAWEGALKETLMAGAVGAALGGVPGSVEVGRQAVESVQRAERLPDVQIERARRQEERTERKARESEEAQEAEKTAAEEAFLADEQATRRVAELGDEPSRTEFAKAIGVPRNETPTKARRIELVAQAKDRAIDYDITEALETEPETETAEPNVTSRVQAMTSEQRATFFKDPESARQFRDELLSLPTGQIRSTFDIGQNTSRKDAVAHVMRQYVPQGMRVFERVRELAEGAPKQIAGPVERPGDLVTPQPPSIDFPVGPVPQKPTPKPAPTPKKPVQTKRPDEGPNDLGQGAKPQPTPPDTSPTTLDPRTVEQIRNMDADEAKAFMDAMGIKKPKGKGKKQSPKALQDHIISEMTKATQKVSFKKGKSDAGVAPQTAEPTGQKEGPQRETKKGVRVRDDEQGRKEERKTVTPEVVKKTEKLPRKTTATKRKVDLQEALQKEGRKQTKTGKHLTGKEHKDRGWRTINWVDRSVDKPPALETTPKTEAEREIDALARELGWKPVWFTGTVTGGTATGAYIFMQQGYEGGSADSMWGLFAHELAHATGLDALQSSFSKKLLNQSAQEYYNNAPPKLKELLDDDPERLQQEAVAVTLQRFMEDKGFRDRVFKNDRSAWERLVTFLNNMFSMLSGSNNADVQAAVEILQKELNRKGYAEAVIQREANEVADEFIKDGVIPEEDREDFINRRTEAFNTAFDKRTERWNSEDQLFKRAIAYGINHQSIDSINKQGGDYESRLKSGKKAFKRFDEFVNDNANHIISVYDAVQAEANHPESRSHLFQEFQTEHVGETGQIDSAEVSRMAWDILSNRWQTANRFQKPKNGLDEGVQDDGIFLETPAQGWQDIESMIDGLPKKQREDFYQAIDDMAEYQMMETGERLNKKDTQVRIKAYMKVIDAATKMPLEDDGGNKEDLAPFSAKDSGEDNLSEGSNDDKAIEILRKIPNFKEVAKEIMKRNKGKFPTPAELKAQRVYGRATHVTSQEARNQTVLADLASGPSEYIPQERMYRDANALLAQNGMEHYEKRFMENANKADDTPLTQQEHIIMTWLLNSTGLEAHAEGGKKLARFRTLQEYFRRTRAELARRLAYRDPNNNSPINWRRKQILDFLDSVPENVQKEIIDILKREGININDPSILKSRGKTIRILNRIRDVAQQRDPESVPMLDKLMEYWYASILSGPQTFAANLLGNSGMALYHFILEKPLEAASRGVRQKITGKRKSEQGILVDEQGTELETDVWGEITEPFRYGMKGFHAGLQAAITGMRDGYSPFELETGVESNMKYGVRAKAIGQGPFGEYTVKGDSPLTRPFKGAKINIGSVVRSPFIAMGFVDEFAKMMSGYMEAASVASRIAKTRGITDADARRSFIDKMVMDLQSPAWHQAALEAKRITFQQEAGVVGEALGKALPRMAKKSPYKLVRYPAKLIAPFSDTGTNLLSASAEMTPVIGLGFALIDSIAGKKNLDHFDKVVAQQLIGTLAALGAWLALEELEEKFGVPIVTGTTPVGLGRAGERNLMYRSAPPMSVYNPLDDSYYNYARVEPFSTVVAALVDARNKYIKGTADPNIMRGLVVDKTYMQTVGDVIRAVESESMAAGAGEVTSNIAVGLLPNLYRQTARETRNLITDKRIRKDDTPTDIAQKLGRKLEIDWMYEDLSQRYDIWGRPITRHSYDTPIWYRTAVPFKRKSASEIIEADAALQQWNAIQRREGKQPYFPTAPRLSSFTYRGKKLEEETPGEAEQFVVDRGQYAWKLLDDRVTFSNPPTDREIKMIKEAFRRGGQHAKRELIKRRRQTAGSQ